MILWNIRKRNCRFWKLSARLIGQGTDLQKLRAGDIAREAGVGKGLFTFTLIPRNNHRGNLCYMMELRISALEETAQKPGTVPGTGYQASQMFSAAGAKWGFRPPDAAFNQSLPLLWEVGEGAAFQFLGSAECHYPFFSQIRESKKAFFPPFPISHMCVRPFSAPYRVLFRLLAPALDFPGEGSGKRLGDPHSVYGAG